MRKKVDWFNYFIELIIVIIGISVAFWLNNLASNARERKLETTFLEDIRSDLKTDSISLGNNILFNNKKVEILSTGLSSLINGNKNQDTLLQIVGVMGNYNFFYPEEFTLNSLFQSGDIKHINSAEIKREILRLRSMYDLIHQEQINLLQALDDNYFPIILDKVDMVRGDIPEPEFFYTITFTNYVMLVMNDTERHSQFYKNAEIQVDKVIRLIESRQ